MIRLPTYLDISTYLNLIKLDSKRIRKKKIIFNIFNNFFLGHLRSHLKRRKKMSLRQENLEKNRKKVQLLKIGWIIVNFKGPNLVMLGTGSQISLKKTNQSKINTWIHQIKIHLQKLRCHPQSKPLQST